MTDDDYVPEPCAGCSAPATWLITDPGIGVVPLCDTCRAESYPDD